MAPNMSGRQEILVDASGSINMVVRIMNLGATSLHSVFWMRHLKVLTS